MTSNDNIPTAYEKVAKYMSKLREQHPLMDAEDLRWAPYNWQIVIDQKLVDKWIDEEFVPPPMDPILKDFLANAPSSV